MSALEDRYGIRVALPDEVEQLPAIERAAASLFDPADLGELSAADTQGIETLAAAQREGRLFVALDGGELVGFALADLLGSEAYLREIDVLPAYGRRGIGTALVATVVRWAREGGRTSLVLSTFRDVVWNAPFYARLGFRALDASALGAEHRALLAREAKHGLPLERRVVMRLELGAAAAALAEGPRPSGSTHRSRA